jgi:DNA topoisomerase-1
MGLDKKVSLYTVQECERIAAAAALRYIKDDIPGFSRRKSGGGFIYYDWEGKKVTDKATLKRIKSLAIPPAYQNVWICSKANGHIQATGLDDKHRKQYIYHPLWHEVRQQQKFDSLIEFGRCLPYIRKHINKQLKKTLELNKEQVICAIIYLLDTACIRIGTSRYAKKNQSFGLTTLRKKHISITRNEAILDFPGKNAHLWHVILKNKRLIKLLKKCEEIPGYELFKYYTEDKKLNIITSQDVNGYLQSLTQHSFTAKDFRTWIACRESFYRLVKKNCSSKEQIVIQEVAKLLGHTPTICRKNYIAPDIINWWKEGRLSTWIKKQNISLRNKDKLLLAWLESKENNKPKPV